MKEVAVPVIQFNQYNSGTKEDLLYLFVAKARDIDNWVGIPRKGWRIRMLYQRWVKASREKELETFWNRASKPDRDKNQKFILSPTAITVAIQGDVEIKDGKIYLRYESPISPTDSPVNNLRRLVNIIGPVVFSRLTSGQKALVEEFRKDPLTYLPDYEHDYILEFAFQLVQMQADPVWFIENNNINNDELEEMVIALEALCRPALVVDGQHRLSGAAEADSDVYIPVVAIPKCEWIEQIYQFIVINEKAEKVDSSLLTDIFGSSLTKEEQYTIRDRLNRANVDVESRIAAVIANRDSRSPFYQMVRVAIGGSSKDLSSAYITDNTVRSLISGSNKFSKGWRTDDDFYNLFIKPTFPDREKWESWHTGKWLNYWFDFWETVKNYYNEQGRKIGCGSLWNKSEQTNLTKAVTMRILQTLFIDIMVERMRNIENSRDVLIDILGEEAADEKINEENIKKAIPESCEDFVQLVEDEFLNYIPIRVFTTPWVKSLDDDQGRTELYEELKKAYTWTKKKSPYRVGNKAIFDIRQD